MPDVVRGNLRCYVAEHPHDDGAVPAVDETGHVKQGSHAVEVPWQHTGTVGQIENSRVTVHLVYAGSRAHAAVEREPYIPRS